MQTVKTHYKWSKFKNLDYFDWFKQIYFQLNSLLKYYICINIKFIITYNFYIFIFKKYYYFEDFIDILKQKSHIFIKNTMDHVQRGKKLKILKLYFRKFMLIGNMPGPYFF